MKGYVKLRRGLLEHFKVMTSSEIKVYIGLLLLANFKSAMVKITLAELTEETNVDRKILINSLRRLHSFGYVKYTPAKNQWHSNIIEIMNYNGSVKNTRLSTLPTPLPSTLPSTLANDITPNNLKDLQNPKKSKEEIRSIKKALSPDDFLLAIKNNPAYSHINIDFELGKMDAWLLAHKGRQKTQKFVVNWLNKIDKPLAINKPTIGRKP